MRKPDGLEGVPVQFWRMVALAGHRLLMLDYDGTLAPFRVERQEARPSPRTSELLREIAASTHTTLAIVSGRPLTEVEALLDGLRAIVVGEHGWERRTPGGEILRRPLDHAVVPILEAAVQIATESGWGDLLERKRSAIVLHTRGLTEARAQEVQTHCSHEWGRLAHHTAVVLDPIQGGLELRARGRNKGTVVLSLISQSPAGTLGVFVGDDVTDEDAFDVVRDWGFGIRVGDRPGPSVAQGRLESCEAMPEFLEEWLRVSRVAPGVH